MNPVGPITLLPIIVENYGSKIMNSFKMEMIVQMSLHRGRVKNIAQEITYCELHAISLCIDNLDLQLQSLQPHLCHCIVRVELQAVP